MGEIADYYIGQMIGEDDGRLFQPRSRTKTLNYNKDLADFPDNKEGDSVSNAEDKVLTKKEAKKKLVSKANKLGEVSEKFWMVACHTNCLEYEKDRGSDSPPRVKFSSKAEADRIAMSMATNYRNRFYVLEAVGVAGEYTTKEYKALRAEEKRKKEEDDALS